MGFKLNNINNSSEMIISFKTIFRFIEWWLDQGLYHNCNYNSTNSGTGFQ